MADSSKADFLQQIVSKVVQLLKDSKMAQTQLTPVGALYRALDELGRDPVSFSEEEIESLIQKVGEQSF